MRCWLYYQDDEAFHPIWATTSELALLAAAEYAWDGEAAESDLVPFPDWDDVDHIDNITPDQFFEHDFGVPCASCGEFVYAFLGDVFWTLDGRPVHGPGQDAHCYDDIPCMPRTMYDYIQSNDVVVMRTPAIVDAFLGQARIRAR